MISTDFAANESWDDALLSLQLILQPWRWIHGKEIETSKKQLLNLISQSDTFSTVTYFLTGRAALYYYLQALNLERNTDILIQAFTCEAVPLPIIASGHNPIYVDIESETFSMNIEDLKKKITPRSKVLILQHTFGFTPKFRNEILRFAQEHNLLVLEDLAHGFNPNIFKKSANDNQTSAYLLSFGRSKAFSSVFGGAIVTNDTEVSARLNTTEKSLPLPSTAFIFQTLLYKPFTMLIKSTYDIFLGKMLHKILNAFHLLIPEITAKEKRGQYDTIFAKSLPNALAILLIHQLEKYSVTTTQRMEITMHYSGYLKEKNMLTTTIEQLQANYLTRFPLLINNRDEVFQRAMKKNVYLGKWYNQVVSPKELNLDAVKYTQGQCPVAESIANKIINLPLLINKTDADTICQII